MDLQKAKNRAQNEFIVYLNLHKHRKTPERFAILDHIYSIKSHFDVDDLFQAMNASNFRVSRATLYNTINLLLECGLLIKHQFGSNIAQFERVYGNDSHDHFICTTCGKVKEYKNNGASSVLNQKRRIRFQISFCSTYIYGTCAKCMKNEQSAKKNKIADNNKKTDIK